MELEPIFSKQTSDGRTVVVYGGEYLGRAIIRKVTINGESIKGISDNVYSLPKPQGLVTHYIAGKTPIGLTSDESSTIIHALDRLQRDIDATNAPIVVTANLRNERRDLVLAYRGLCDEQAYQFERAHDRSTGRKCMEY